MVETEVEDDDFLNQLAAAEAEALSAKRRKITTTNSSSVSEEEGSYIAALKGSRSLLFQQQFSNTTTSYTIPKPNGGSAGSCFKCGKSGHWARDCESNANSSSSFAAVAVAVAVAVAEKACPCGLGVCIVLTANTDKNRGRKFYKCPLREESGGCGFFEWCDKSSGTDNMNTRSQSYTLNHSVPELSCPCGAGSCLTLTAKTGKNIGQQFYRCPASQESCGFFKWCNDHTTTTTTTAAISDSKVYKNSFNEMGNKNYGGGGGSCFKCGKDGHWSKDCSSVSSNTCFNCGKPGHWAKDCSSSPTAASTWESENRKIRYLRERERD